MKHLRILLFLLSPSLFAAPYTNTMVQASWELVTPPVDGYRVLWKTNGAPAWSSTLSITGAVQSVLIPGTNFMRGGTYAFALRSFSGTLESADSPIQLLTLVDPPTTPRAISVIQLTVTIAVP